MKKPDSNREQTRKIVMYGLILVLIGLEIAFVAMTILAKPTSDQLVILIPVMLTPIAGLVATMVNAYFGKK